jgi:hypothetical protein
MLKRLVVVAAALAAAPAYADDPKFEFGKAEEVEKVKETEVNASAEIGLVFTTGNSETTTVSAGMKASRKQKNNKLAVEGSATYARAGQRVLSDLNGNGMIDNANEITTVRQVTAESYAGKVRYDRFLTKHNSLFVAALIGRDLPAGKELTLGAQLGYSRQLYKSEKAEAVGEGGLDYSNENLVGDADSLKILSGRAFVGYKAEMTEGTTFDSSGELLVNLNDEGTLATGADGGVGKDFRLVFKASVSSKIGKSLAFQSSIEAKYDNRPAPLALKDLAMGFVPEASGLDTIMKASLIYTFF